MAVEAKYPAVNGKTYTLFGERDSTEEYYSTVKRLLDSLTSLCPDQEKLLLHIREAGRRRRGKKTAADPALVSLIKNISDDALSGYTNRVPGHLRGLSLLQRLDETLRTKRQQYHLFMLEISLINRIRKKDFLNSDYKFALLPHCLRDFRAGCRSVPGDIEAVCGCCTKGCFINMGSSLLKKYGIQPYISVEIDQEKLFTRLKAEHNSIGALGIACIPELARGMRLCMELGINPLGIPLDANRCRRWMKKTEESSFSLGELEELLR